MFHYVHPFEFAERRRVVSLYGISLVQLRRFLVLADELHFSRTAERLGVSQPLLSEQIRDLEALLRVKLFDRSSRKVQLTPAGDFLKSRVSLLMLALEEAVLAARDIHGGGNTPLRIGYTDEFTRFLLPELTSFLKSSYPRAEISLTCSTVPKLLEKLDSGLIDVALLSPMFEEPPQPDWEVTIFPPMPLSVAMADDHPLAKERALSVSQLADEAFLEGPADPAAAPSGSEVLVNRLFARQGIARNIVQRLDDPHLAVGLAAAGVGIFVASLESARGVPGLSIVPLNEPEAILTCGAVSRHSNETALLKACRVFLRQRSLIFDEVVAA